MLSRLILPLIGIEEESNVEVSPFPSFKIESDVMFAVVDGVPAEDELENSRC